MSGEVFFNFKRLSDSLVSFFGEETVKEVVGKVEKTFNLVDPSSKTNGLRELTTCYISCVEQIFYGFC